MYIEIVLMLGLSFQIIIRSELQTLKANPLSYVRRFKAT